MVKTTFIISQFLWDRNLGVVLGLGISLFNIIIKEIKVVNSTARQSLVGHINL